MLKLRWKIFGIPSDFLGVSSFFFLLLIHSQYLHFIYPTTINCDDSFVGL